MRRLAAAAVTLAVATAVAADSDSQAQLLGGPQPLSVQTPSLNVQAPGASVEVAPVTLAPPAPVTVPEVTVPPTPVSPPVPVSPPPAPVAPPSQPVQAPSVRVEAPSAEAPSVRVDIQPSPRGQSAPASPSLPGPSLSELLSQPGSSPSVPRLPSLRGLLGGDGGSGSGAAPATVGPAAIAGALTQTIPGMARFPSPSQLAKLPAAQRRKLVRLAFGTPLQGPRLRLLRSTIREHSDCLGVLPSRGRRALELRAGLFGRDPVSRRVVARRIGTSPRGVLRLERSSLRRLIDAGERGQCATAGATAAAIGGSVTGSGGTADASSDANGDGDAPSAGTGGDLRPAGEVLADVAEGGPGLDLGDGEEGAAESLLSFLLVVFALLIPLAAMAVVAQRRAGNAAAAGRAGERPLLFLDVDGVIALSVFSDGLPPGEMRESPLGFIYLPDRTGGLVRQLAAHFDIVWATGWEHHANTGLLSPLGLREELPVLTFGKKARSGSSEWKLKRVNAYAGRRPAAWLDDNLVERHERWAAERPQPTLLVPVDPRSGLTQDHVEQLVRWAERLETSQATARAKGHRQVRTS
jgi:HAD domain in Swiss Army Knife RNA repair proteins